MPGDFAQAEDRALERALRHLDDLEGLALEPLRDVDVDAEAPEGLASPRLLVGDHPGDRAAQHHVRLPRVERTDAPHPARGAPPPTALRVLAKDDAPTARDDRLLRVHDDDFLPVQEALRDDARQAPHHMTGRVDDWHAHPMIRTPRPVGSCTASSRRLRAFPPAASTFRRAASEARKAATVMGTWICPVARRTPGTTIFSPFVAYRSRRDRFTSDQFLRDRSRRSATSRQIATPFSRERSRSSRTTRWSRGFVLEVVPLETALGRRGQT